MRIPTHARRWVAVAVAGSSAVALAVVAPQSAGAATRPHVLPSSKPAWTANAATAGTTATNTTVQFGVLLAMRNQAAAQAQVKALSTPGSASYGKWLTASQFKASYSPTAASVASVQKWLKQQGFGVTKTYQSGLLVQARGTVAQINKTFGTTVKNYKYQGKTVRSNSTNLSLPSGTPSAVVGAVSGVVGIDQGSALKKPAATLPPPAPGSYFGVQPCSSYFGQKVATTLPAAPNGKKAPYAVCGYVPQQLQSAYGEKQLLNAGVTGKGVTVAITDAYASPTIVSDIATYSANHGLPQMKKGQFRQITPAANGYDLINECGASGWYGEESLDVDAVHAMAPGANIVYVGGADCSTGLDDAWASTIDNHVADIVTNSWADSTDSIADLGLDYVTFYQTFSLEAALTGITVNFSTGDSGDETSGGTDLAAKTVDFPSDLPYVTGVGGTSIAINKNGVRTADYGWQSAYYSTQTKTGWTNEAYSSGGGGGTSTLFAQPFYQAGIVPDSMSKYFGSTRMRTTPDISMDADPNTGMRVGQTQTFSNGTFYAEYRIGGTSLAAPLLAGVLAVADQLVGHPLGFVNPMYYALSGTRAITDTIAPKGVYQARTNLVDPSDLHSGLTYLLQQVDVQTTTSKDVRGYDTATGVGTPSGLSFFAGLGITGYGTAVKP